MRNLELMNKKFISDDKLYDYILDIGKDKTTIDYDELENVLLKFCLDNKRFNNIYDRDDMEDIVYEFVEFVSEWNEDACNSKEPLNRDYYDIGWIVEKYEKLLESESDKKERKRLGDWIETLMALDFILYNIQNNLLI